MAVIEIKVPDIGDYTDVPVIEILVAVGDTVKKDQGLVTLESDKATLEVPSSAAGVVKELKVKLGDTLSEGSVVAILEAEGVSATPPPPAGEVGARSATGEGGASYGAEISALFQSETPPSPRTLSRERERGSDGRAARDSGIQLERPPSPVPSPASGRGG